MWLGRSAVRICPGSLFRKELVGALLLFPFFLPSPFFDPRLGGINGAPQMRWCYPNEGVLSPEMVFFGGVPGFATPRLLAAGSGGSI